MSLAHPSFAQQLASLDWDDQALQLRATTPAQVEQALARSRRTLADFAALISPAAEPYLPQLAAQAQRLTRQRFGHSVQFYVPLYLSNLCANDCSYCGFSMSNAIRRVTLDEAAIAAECQALRQRGFDAVLLVSGEHQRRVGMDYFRQQLPLVRRYFSHVSMEVQPLAEAEYRELKALGLDGVMVYQESYHRRTYAAHHLRGSKQDFDYRLATPERLGRAGVDKIGLGVLLGLADDWRCDSLMAAHHLQFLQQHYWRSRYSLSFPRLRPCVGQSHNPQLPSDRQLVQLICAWRLLFPELELSLSTREPAALRDRLAPLAITHLSAESSTQPGGYSEATAAALEQFSTADQRPLAEVAAAMQRVGLQPVWKDWQPELGRS